MAYFSLGADGFMSSPSTFDLTEDPFINAGIIQSQNSMAKRQAPVCLDPQYENISDDDFDSGPGQVGYVFLFMGFIGSFVGLMACSFLSICVFHVI